LAGNPDYLLIDRRCRLEVMGERKPPYSGVANNAGTIVLVGGWLIAVPSVSGIMARAQKYPVPVQLSPELLLATSVLINLIPLLFATPVEFSTMVTFRVVHVSIGKQATNSPGLPNSTQSDID
jgi:hypothetical protein